MAAGLVPLLVLAAWRPTVASAQVIKSDWPRVQAVSPKTKTEVQLYKDEVPQGSRKIKGRFDSATTDSITLRLKGGQTRTLQKQTVYKVLIHRPFKKRWPGWATAVISTAIWAPKLASHKGDLTALGILVLAGAFIAAPTAIVFLTAQTMRGIYNVPPKHRTRTQGDKQSGAQGKAPGKPQSPRRD